MYGMPAKRFDPDYYKNNPIDKKLDFALGFALAALVWVVFFNPHWWLAPLLVFCAAMAGVFFKFRRRYVIYGALALVFFPLALWGGLMIVWAGRNEIKS